MSTLTTWQFSSRCGVATNFTVMKRKMIKKCIYCGAEYESAKASQKYCSDLCRMRAFRESKRNEQKQLRKIKRIAPEIQSPTLLHMDASDPRRRLCKMKSKGLFSIDYWKLFQEVDIKYYGGESIVNGIPTKYPEFPELVLLQIEIDERIFYCTDTNRTNGKQPV